MSSRNRRKVLHGEITITNARARPMAVLKAVDAGAGLRVIR